jgi:hypothetical protein
MAVDREQIVVPRLSLAKRVVVAGAPRGRKIAEEQLLVGKKALSR